MSAVFRIAILGAMALGSVAEPARAQSAQACYEATLASDDDKVIAVCSGALKAGKMSTVTLSRTYSNRGLGYLRKGQFDKSIPDFNEAIRLDAKNAFAYDNRGDAHREKGQFDKAIADYNAAIRADPTFASSYLNRALAYEKMGNLQSARADLEAVLRFKGDREIDKWARTEADRHLKRLNAPPAKKL